MDDDAPGAVGIRQVVAPLPYVRPTEVGAACREDPDLEPIRPANLIAVPHGDPELEGPCAVDGSGPLELRLRATDHQPVETRRFQRLPRVNEASILAVSFDPRPFDELRAPDERLGARRACPEL